MAELEKVIKGLYACTTFGEDGATDGDCNICPYNKGYKTGECWVQMNRDALELLKEQEGTGCWEWITEDKYRCSECQNTTYVDECLEEPQYLFCPYCGHKMTFAGRN